MALPDAGRIAVFAPRVGADLRALPQDRVEVITGFKPDADYFGGLGYTCVVAPEGRYGAAIVYLPRAKMLARALVAEAAAVTDGPIIVDGAKTYGIESMLKECRRRVAVSAPMSKAHGKIFSFPAGPEFTDWAAGMPEPVEGGFVTAPGVFSADGIDPASRFLGDHLPVKIGAHVVDLGGGWGYLTARALERESIAQLDIVEADHAALDCARVNVTDPRAQFHWSDALTWKAPENIDTVVMNPPFHEGRAADTGLGVQFIEAAARCLGPHGRLWMVANRHLPYEKTLQAAFTEVRDIGGTSGYKLTEASRPRRQRK